MRLAIVLTAVLALLAVACGGGDDTSPVTLTVVNSSGQTVDVSINGEHSSLDAGGEDAITLEGSTEYRVLVTGESGGVLYTGTLTAGDIRDMDGRLVVSAVAVSPG